VETVGDWTVIALANEYPQVDKRNGCPCSICYTEDSLLAFEIEFEQEPEPEPLPEVCTGTTPEAAVTAPGHKRGVLFSDIPVDGKRNERTVAREEKKAARDFQETEVEQVATQPPQAVEDLPVPACKDHSTPGAELPDATDQGVFGDDGQTFAGGLQMGT
jgi:hypothetical protein